MVYTKRLPRTDSIERLARATGPYPAKARRVLRQAETLGFGQSTLDFLRQFPSDEVFESRSDLLTRCEELDLLFREEREMPQETLRSPQEMTIFLRKEN